MSVDLLIDTHAMIWFALDDERWRPLFADALEDRASTVSVSSLSWAEIAIKRSLGKLDIDVERLQRGARRIGFLDLPFTANHAQQLAQLPLHHRDPFDRMLIAQAMSEDMAIVTADAQFAKYAGLRLYRT